MQDITVIVTNNVSLALQRDKSEENLGENVSQPRLLTLFNVFLIQVTVSADYVKSDSF